MILPLLNGMRHLDTLDARFTPHNVLGGLCRIVGDMDADGRILQMTPLSELSYGERNQEQTARIQAVDETLRGCGFDARLSSNILADMWVKWMMLASLGTINVLSRGSIGTVQALTDLDGCGERFERNVLHEAISVATAHGYPPSDAARAMMMHRLTEPGSSLESSMYRDFTRGNSVEAMQIVGDMVRRGRQHNVPTPLLEAAFIALRLYELSRNSNA